MHYTIHYDLSKPTAAREAINDAIRYNRVGVEEFLWIMRRWYVYPWHLASIFLAFRGIQGFPARALYAYVLEKPYEEVFP